MAGSVVVAPVVQTSFFKKVELELKKLFVHAPGWEASAAATMTYIAPMVETLVALTDPAAAPVVNGLIAKVQSAMAAATVVIKDAGPTPTLNTYLNSILANLVQIEDAAQIKDPGTTAKLTALVGTITGEVQAIVTEVGATA